MGLSDEIIKEVKRYDDGNGCTRGQLVDNILILFDQWNTRVRASVAAPQEDPLLSDEDGALLAHAITIAREVQEFIWADCYPSLRPYDAEGWRRLFQKRVDCIAEIELTKHGGLAALRKRLLQQAALSIKALALINRWAKANPPQLSAGGDGTDLRQATATAPVTPSTTPAGEVSAAPVVDKVRFLAAERAAYAARQFCEELQEDTDGVPQLQLSELNRALDAWEAYPDARESFDDSQPVLAALASLIEDEHATDHQRRVAHLALSALRAAAPLAATPADNDAEGGCWQSS